MTKQTSRISLKKTEILVVDDEPQVIENLEALLTDHGYSVISAIGGINACDKLLRHNVDLVLLDLNMQDKNGHEVMRFMTENNIDTATIVISGESSFSTLSRSLRRGSYDYLKKPYDPEELIATVASALRQKSLESAHASMQKKLKHSEELHRFIVNNSPDIIFMLDQRGRFAFLNSKIERQLGYTKTKLIGAHYSIIVAEQDKDKAAYHLQFESPWLQESNRVATLRNNGRTKSFEINLVMANKSGSRYYEITIFPIKQKTRKLNGIRQAPNHKTKIISLYGTARDITEKKEAEDFIHYQAYHDLLTRLPNRALFKDRLSLSIAQAKRNNSKLAVMFLDLDRFKVVNDTLGHTMGDHLLQTVATRLGACLRDGDTLSHFGGDEFTLLLPELSSREDARHIARKIMRVLKEPFPLAEHDVFVGVSIGISMFPDAGVTAEELIQNSDAAMYHVKGRGKDGYQFYVNGMNNRSSGRLKLERDLRGALKQNELNVYYQPKVNAITGDVIGVEALVRWHHPEKGIIYPSEFLPLAEETKLIIDISEWVLETACREVNQWIQNGHEAIRLAVNFSPKQIEHPRFVNQLINQLKLTGFPRQNLEIEISENVIMNNLEHIVQKLNSLAEYGVSIAVDDFGTGYSSLSYLHKLPIHTLKLDQSFVKGLHNQPGQPCIVNAIIAMAQGLKLNIVAEGVETAEQYAYLKKLGCHEIQGFYFGKAQPANHTLAMINQKPSELAV
ncbi:MAG: two-component system response regulator [Gammaproteobacteria bacterium]|nr:MAG: two-component system response regulator [Gammaproteobacteria bacterium]